MFSSFHLLLKVNISWISNTPVIAVITKAVLVGKNVSNASPDVRAQVNLFVNAYTRIIIENNLKSVEAGAQGAHKIKRGYLAKPTYSYHFIPNQSFRKAILNFIEYEKNEVADQINYVNQQKNPYSKQN